MKDDMVYVLTAYEAYKLRTGAAIPLPEQPVDIIHTVIEYAKHLKTYDITEAK